MSQVSSKLRRLKGAYGHWCLGCGELHGLPDSWQFNGDLENPTFSPSFKHEGVETIKDANGEWTGEWKRDASGNTIPFICHYIVTNGNIAYCSDSSHDYAGKTIPMPELPPWLQDSQPSGVRK